MTAAVKITRREYDRMAIGVLREFAHQSHPHHDDEATREYVRRLADLELERRLDIVRRRPGWHSASPGFGDGTGASTKPSDAMYLAYIKGIPNSHWHDHARIGMKKLPARNLIALMFSTAKVDSRLDRDGNSPWAKSFDHIAEASPYYAQLVDWPPGIAKGMFGNGQAIKRAAHQARVELIMQAKIGLI